MIRAGDLVTVVSIKHTEGSFGHTDFMYQIGDSFIVLDMFDDYSIRDSRKFIYSVKDLELKKISSMYKIY